MATPPKETKVAKAPLPTDATGGTRARYSVHSATRLTSDVDQFGKQAQGSTGTDDALAVHSQLKATWTELEITRKAGARLRAITIDSLDMSSLIGGQVVNPPPGSLDQILKTTTYLVLNPKSGDVESIYFDPSLSELEQNVFRTVISFRQFVYGEDPQAARWTAREEDLNGVALTEYVREESAGPKRTYVKKKTKYLPEPFRWTPRQAPIEKVFQATGAQTFTIDANGVVGAVGDEVLSLKAAGRSLRTTKTKYTLTRSEHVPLTLQASNEGLGGFEQSLRTRQMAKLYQPVSQKKTPAAQHERDLEGLSLQDLLTTLAAIEKDPDNTRKQQRSIYHHLKAWIALHPTQVNGLRAALVAASVEAPVLGLLCSTLATAGTPDAQALIVEALKAEPKNVERVTTIISYIGRMEAPTQETRDAMLALVKSTTDKVIREAASLSIGGLALMSRAASEGSEDALVSWMASQFKAASTPRDRILMLRVIGNSGADRLLPLVRPYLTHEDETYRRYAAQSLRWFRTEEAEHIILEILQNDPESSVRLPLAESYQFRPINEPIVPKLIQVALSDDSDQVRLTLAANLWRSRARFPAIEAAVRKLAKEDRDAKVRDDLSELVGLSR